MAKSSASPTLDPRVARLEAQLAERDAEIRRLRALLAAEGKDPEAVCVRLPFPPLPSGKKVPGRRIVQLTLTGQRARKAYAVLQGLQERDAHIVLRRGSHDNEVRVRDLNHVFLYLLDTARLVLPSSAGE